MNAVELKEALTEMRRNREAVRIQAETIADLFLEAIQDARPGQLAEIKRRLGRFNSKTWKWKK